MKGRDMEEEMRNSIRLWDWLLRGAVASLIAWSTWATTTIMDNKQQIAVTNSNRYTAYDAALDLRMVRTEISNISTALADKIDVRLTRIEDKVDKVDVRLARIEK